MLTELFPCASPRHQAFAQLTSAFISLVLLTSFTTLFFLDAWEVTFAQEAFDTSCCDVPSTLAQVEADFAAANSGADSLIAADCLLVGGACEAAVASFDPAAPLWENAPLCAGSAASPQLDSGGPACTWSGVDPRVVFAFALFGLVFDVASLFTFRYWTDPEEMEEAEAVNMGSAFLHLASDFLRSTTTLVLSLLIFANPAQPSYLFDGSATLFITATILAGAAAGLWQWAVQMSDLLCGREKAALRPFSVSVRASAAARTSMQQRGASLCEPSGRASGLSSPAAMPDASAEPNRAKRVSGLRACLARLLLAAPPDESGGARSSRVSMH